MSRIRTQGIVFGAGVLHQAGYTSHFPASESAPPSYVLSEFSPVRVRSHLGHEAYLCASR